MLTQPNSSRYDNHVTAVLVTYRSKKIISGAIDSLINDQGLSQIIVVDNASNDGLCEFVREQFPQVTVISNSTNLGFGAANNLGLNNVTTPFALVLNPDVRLPTGGVNCLLELMQSRPNVAIAGPWPSQEQAYAPTVKTSRFGAHVSTLYKPDLDVDTHFLVGAALLMRMDTMRKVGFFDPEIFLYYEDDDISERVIRAGHQLLLTSRVLMDHQWGQSSTPIAGLQEMKERHFSWSRLYLEKKFHGERHALAVAHSRLRSYQRSLWFRRLTLNKAVQKYQSRIAGIQDFLAGRSPPIRPELCVQQPLRRSA